MRSIADRFINYEDRDWFINKIDTLASETLSNEHFQHYSTEENFFVDFLRDAPEPSGEEGEEIITEAPKLYEEVPDFDSTKERIAMYMNSFNEQMRGMKMDLVFFHDAMMHLMIISRILRTPR